MFDIQVFPYRSIAGKEETALAGLFTSAPPRRAARGRENDQLILLLSLQGSTSLEEATQQEMLEKVAGTYYRTKGTVTHALKIIVEQLNERLVARSMRLQGKGLQLFGVLNAVVVHGKAVFIAHSGLTHSFVLNREAVQIFSGEGGSRGLGMGRAVNVHFYRAEVQPDDLVLLCTHPPTTWNEKALAGSPQLSLDDLRRLLLSESNRDMRFVMLRFQRGKGEIRQAALRPVEGLPAIQPGAVAATEERPPDILAAPVIEPPPIAPEPESLPAPRPPLDDRASPLIPAAIEEPPDFPPHLEVKEELPGVEQAPWAVEEPPAVAPARVGAPEAERVLRRRQVDRRAKRTVSAALSGGRTLREKTAAFLHRFLPRVLPGQADTLPALSPAVMIFIAIAVPLVIVAAASTAYIRSGRNEQHRAYLAQAQTLLDQAAVQSDLTLRRINMDAALEWVEKAETYGSSAESTAMKDQVQSALDSLDGIRRVRLELALPSGFDTGVRVTRIVASQAEDLFMLDANSGRVFRLIYTRPGYEVDTQFVCGPGMLGGLIIGPLVDIAAAPPGNMFDAAVMGMDEFGNLLYCSVVAANTTAVTLPAPDAGWGKIKAISVDASSMLVLDTGANAVWRYEGFNGEYLNPPRFFFDSQVPNLSGGIDLFQNRDELFVLNQDGHMIQCTYSNVYLTPTRCSDPFPYQMAVMGQTSQEVVTPNARFERMQVTQPPEPSIYFIDSSDLSIYQFSLVLNFVAKLKPSADSDALPQAAPSGFVVTRGRNLIIAFGNQIYTAPLPAP